MEFTLYKLEIFVPESHFEAVRQALSDADAGHIGRYDQCLSVSRATGFWRPLEGAHPYQGRAGELCCAEELKVEVCCRAERLEETLLLVKKAHPYEEPVINVLPLCSTSLQILHTS
ncbi:cytochrome C biogenesis protein [Anaerofilum sp. BX8]|uniref:Cytochrome C biogenesis protein n=1 Tax=Anaerofilum hominis TaxID=2763016 RepID=A0A923I4M6_9FIRM|nr:cytochrome C biogenesis protein [Anaerofilum hominis]MBC5580261.1 cytochrome C biogenesis protein [Anaerofilum hominis]